jgi:hypothetical protein
MLDDLISGAIPDVIQLIGFVLLQLATLGRYARVRRKDAQLLEGAVGFVAVAAAIWVMYKVIA